MTIPAQKYLACFSTGLKAGFEYRANIFFSIAGAISPIVIQTALWTVLYATGSEATLFGFSRERMIAYTILAQLVSRLVRTGFEYDINNDIHSGTLDRYLVKPVGYFGFRLFSFIGDKCAQTIVMAVIIAAAVFVMSFAFGMNAGVTTISLFLAAVACAFILNFLIFWCVALCGFWLTEIGFLFEAMRIVIISLSGGIFPLSVFGTQAERYLSLLPFKFTIQFPAELLVGRVDSDAVIPAFTTALCWMIALTLLGQLIWRRGIKKFAAVGS